MSGGGAQYQQGSSSSRQRIDPIQAKYLKKGWMGARDEILRNPLEYYPGQTVASQDPATLDYYGRALDYSQQGDPTLQAAAGYTGDVLAGKYADPASNPYLRGTYDAAARAVTDNYNRTVLPGIESRFARAGGSLSSEYLGQRRIAQDTLGSDLGDLANRIYGGAYQQERGLMDSAARFAPIFAADAQDRLDLARTVGAQREGYQQSILDDLLARFQFRQDEPYTRLSRYANLIGQPTTLSSSDSRSYGGGLQISFPK